jgi:hypothetical protein
MTLIVECKSYLLITIYLSATLRIILGLLSSYNCTNNYNNNDKLMIDDSYLHDAVSNLSIRQYDVD